MSNLKLGSYLSSIFTVLYVLTLALWPAPKPAKAQVVSTECLALADKLHHAYFNQTRPQAEVIALENASVAHNCPLIIVKGQKIHVTQKVEVVAPVVLPAQANQIERGNKADKFATRPNRLFANLWGDVSELFSFTRANANPVPDQIVVKQPVLPFNQLMPAGSMFDPQVYCPTANSCKFRAPRRTIQPVQQQEQPTEVTQRKQSFPSHCLEDWQLCA